MRFMLSPLTNWTLPRVPHSSHKTGSGSSSCSGAQAAAHWQGTYAFARSGEDGVAERGRHAGGARLTNTAGGLAARHQVRLDARCFGDAQRLKIVEVALLDAAVRDGDLITERGAQAEGSPAFELRAHPIGIDHLPAVHGTHHPLDARFAFPVHTDLDNLRQVAAERVLDRHSTSAASR